MRMLRNKSLTLWDSLADSGDLSGLFVADAEVRVGFSDLVTGSAMDGRGDELRGKSVLILVKGQLAAAMVMLELDGIARRIVLCPPDLPLEHLPSVIAAGDVDTIVSDRESYGPDISRIRYFMGCSRTVVPHRYDRTSQCETEWVLLTSGTSGPPKLVVHTLSSLAGAIKPGSTSAEQVVWSTFYDIRRYGGLQIFLRAILAKTSLVLSSPAEPTAGFLARAGYYGITHISGTPSHWRHALMSSSAQLIHPEYVRLSGEIADQGILNQLRSAYPHAKIVHAFASTEAGVAFEVTDGDAGFPASALENTPGIEMKIEDHSLRIRSNRSASRYLGTESRKPLKDSEGFVDTCDMIDLRDGRCYFLGRRDGVINVGGLKVHPEEVEAVINRHPRVEVSRVRTKKNPITGGLVVADVVLKDASSSAGYDPRALQHDILMFCREALSPYKVPGAVYFVPALAIAETGKLVRLA